MKSKLILLLVFVAGLAANDAIHVVTISAETLLSRAAINRNLSREMPAEYAAGYFQGKADALEEIATLSRPLR